MCLQLTQTNLIILPHSFQFFFFLKEQNSKESGKTLPFPSCSTFFLLTTTDILYFKNTETALWI